MAVKPLTTVPVDTTGFRITALNEEAVLESRETGAQRIDKATGLPMWTVDCFVSTESGSGMLSVKISSKTGPGVAGPCELVGLVASHYEIPSAKGLTTGMSFRASGIRHASATPVSGGEK